MIAEELADAVTEALTLSVALTMVDKDAVMVAFTIEDCVTVAVGFAPVVESRVRVVTMVTLSVFHSVTVAVKISSSSVTLAEAAGWAVITVETKEEMSPLSALVLA